MKKVKMWTRLNKEIVDQIHEIGYYRVTKQELVKKYDDCLPIYLEIYDWFYEKAKSMVQIPEGAKYSLLVSDELSPDLAPTDDQVLLELEIHSDDVIITDASKWSYILNYWYLPVNESDNTRYKSKLEARGITNQTQIFMSQFSPDLKQEVINSWDRLFDENIVLSEEKKFSVWEIKKEWIVKETRK